MENRNFIIFISVSIAILFIWDTLFVAPAREAEKARLEAEQQLQAELQVPDHNAAPIAEGAAPSASERPSLDDDGLSATVSRTQALAGGRIAFESEEVIGTISLKGARIDDLTLRDFRQSIDETSPNVVLLSPERTEGAYFADFGWAPKGQVRVPDRNSQWQQVGTKNLTPDNPVELVWDNGQGLTFRRTISLDPKYMFTVKQVVENNAAEAVELFPYGRITRDGQPSKSTFFILHEGFVGVFNGELTEKRYKHILKDGTFEKESTGGWTGITDKYWLTALIPGDNDTFKSSYATRKNGGLDRFTNVFMDDGIVVKPGGRAESTSRFFAGAKQNKVLQDYRDTGGVEKFDMAIDWGWFFFITKPIFSLLEYFGHAIGNFGIAILIVTVIIKALLFPLANKSYESMSKMKKLQPEITSMRERFADDKVKQQQEMMELYKREGVNPLAGCLPMLIQIPIFFALYKTLFVTIEMRQAHFFGWIQDLAAPDPTSILNIFGLLPYDPSTWPLIGTTLGIGFWPLIMGITMFVQMKMNPAPQDPIQEKMFTFMPIVFTFMLARFPAGLVIYWAWNNFLSILQQYVIMRKNDVEVELFKNLKLDRFFGGKEPISIGAEGSTEVSQEKPATPPKDD